MSQNVVDYSGNPKGPGLLDDYLAKDQENYRTSHSGIVRPSYAREGMIWVDKSVSPWLLKIYDGTDDIIIGKVDAGANTFVPSTPMTTKGDILVSDANGKPVRLEIGAVNYILTANGSNNLPSWSKNPIGVYIYESSRTYSLNELVVGSVDGAISIYKSLANNNVGNALSDTTKWVSILSDDANVVHKTGDETIAGVKTINTSQSQSLITKSNTIDNSVTPTSTLFSNYIDAHDINDVLLSRIFTSKLTSGANNICIQAWKGNTNYGIHVDSNGFTWAPSSITHVAGNIKVSTDFQVVSALPSSPTAGVFYFVKE